MTDFSQLYQCESLPKQSPSVLDDPASFWLITAGFLDVFCVPLTEEGAVAAQGLHCFRLSEGQIMLGCPAVTTRRRRFALRGYLSPDAELEGGKVAVLLRRDFDISVVDKIDRWVQEMDICLSRWSPSPPQYHLIEADPDVPYAEGEFLSSHYNSVVWLHTVDSELRYGELRISADEVTPLTHRSTRQLVQDSKVSSYYTPQLLSDPQLSAQQVIHNYQSFFMQALASYSAQESLQNIRNQRRYARAHTQQLQRTRKLLGKALGTRIPEPPTCTRKEEPIVTAIGKALSDWRMDMPAYDQHVIMRGNLKETTSHLGVRARQVKLKNWDLQRENCGHIIYVEEDGTYRLLLPPLAGWRKTYRCFDPQTGNETDLPSAEELPDEGHMLYPPLSARIKTLRQLFKHALLGQKRVVIKFFVIALLNGLFFLGFPFLVSKVLTTWIPYREWGIFITALLGISLTTLASVAMYVFNATLYIAIKGHFFTLIQSGVWQRLLTLPVSFFRQHTVGEIIDRANAMNIADRFFNVSVAQSLSALVSALVSLVLLLIFNPLLAAVVWVIVAVVLCVDYFILKRYITLQLRSNVLQFELNNFVLQIVDALAKLRVARRESFALRQWAERAESKAEINYQAGLMNSAHLSLNSHFFYYTNIAIFALIIWFAQLTETAAEGLIADFLIFNAALLQVSFALVQVAMLSAVALAAVPYLDKVRPIIAAGGEEERRGVRLYSIRGRIEFNGVHFAYPDKSGHLRKALHDINFTVKSGEYVAIVGASGSGKSTLIRLLLGFEKPSRGSVYIDDHDLDTLNLATFRQQMGVVLQTNQIVPASVMKNISLGFEGQANFDTPTLYKRSWAAARQAGIAQDIRNLPMSMDSWLGTGQGMSGGQKQRLLIARALSKKPRIMILDEATSAMDNVTQRDIKLMLNSLNVTRIIIAHRLSTITDVNRVIMMKKGHIVETGSFRGLLRAGGEFSHFAQRQML